MIGQAHLTLSRIEKLAAHVVGVLMLDTRARRGGRMAEKSVLVRWRARL